MTVYPEMNEKIVDLLRMGDTPVELYAAQRIEELELKNKELIDRVLEIIDKLDAEAIEDFELDTDYGLAIVHDRFAKARERIKALKGEHQS